MLSRSSFAVQHAQPVRGMATAQSLRHRIAAVKNIRKITSAMKMVAQCKLRSAQDKLAVARTFQKSLAEVWKPPSSNVPAKNQVWVGISSDRGLCGAVNSSIVRAVRDSIETETEENPTVEASIVLYGEKCKQGLERLYADKLRATISETSKFHVLEMNQCGELADYYLTLPADSVRIFYQKFKSMISYETTEVKFPTYSAVKDTVASDYADYEVEGDADTMQNLYEFRGSVLLFHYFAENETSTLSSRMTAMETSSTNAKDMVDKLTLFLNRSRQAKITTEISEICAGAAALEDVA